MEVSRETMVSGSWGREFTLVRSDANSCGVIYGRKGSRQVRSEFGISCIRTLGWEHGVWFLACIFVFKIYSFNKYLLGIFFMAGALLGSVGSYVSKI